MMTRLGVRATGLPVIEAAPLIELLATFDSTTPSITLLQVAAGVRLQSPPVQGVAAMIVLAGTMRLDVASDMRRTVRAGNLVLVPEGRTAHLAVDDDPGGVVLDGRDCLVKRDGWLIVDATRRRAPVLTVAAGRIAGSRAGVLGSPVVIPVAKARVGRPIHALLRDECGRGRDGHPALAAALMNACVVEGLRGAIVAAPAAGAGAGTRRPEASLIARAVALVRTRPSASHSVDTLADAAGMSRSTFLRHFRRTTGVAPTEFIQRVRLEEARALLETTDLPVKTIAGIAGFASRSHFSRAFRMAFGRDPTSHRGRSAAE